MDNKFTGPSDKKKTQRRYQDIAQQIMQKTGKYDTALTKTAVYTKPKLKEK